MKQTFEVNNVKCGGCANTLIKALKDEFGAVEVVDGDTVFVQPLTKEGKNEGKPIEIRIKYIDTPEKKGEQQRLS